MPKRRRITKGDSKRLEEGLSGILLLLVVAAIVYGTKLVAIMLIAAVLCGYVVWWVPKRKQRINDTNYKPHLYIAPIKSAPKAAASDIGPEIRVRESVFALPATNWSLDLLHRLDWKRFEELLKHYWKAKGFKAEATGRGADGGVDVRLYRPSAPDIVLGIIQCKSRSGKPVGVDKVRELFGLMSHEKVSLGVLATTAGFTTDALAFATGKTIQLIDGKKLFEQISTLSPESQQSLLAHITRGDYETPTCASCDVKMMVKTRKSDGAQFYGCVNFPRCKNIINSAKLNLSSKRR